MVIAAVIRAVQKADIRSLRCDLRQRVKQLEAQTPRPPPEYVALVAQIEFELHAWSRGERANYSAIREAIAAIDDVAHARANAPRGRRAAPVTPTWQDQERTLLVGKLGLPGSQATLERARRRRGRAQRAK